jgi:hypothetical protein
MDHTTRTQQRRGTADRKPHLRNAPAGEVVQSPRAADLRDEGRRVPADRDECAALFVTQARADIAVIHALSDPQRPVDPERLQFTIWRARRALARLEFLVDSHTMQTLYERGLQLEAEAAAEA